MDEGGETQANATVNLVLLRANEVSSEFGLYKTFAPQVEEKFEIALEQLTQILPTESLSVPNRIRVCGSLQQYPALAETVIQTLSNILESNADSLAPGQELDIRWDLANAFWNSGEFGAGEREYRKLMQLYEDQGKPYDICRIRLDLAYELEVYAKEAREVLRLLEENRTYRRGSGPRRISAKFDLPIDYLDDRRSGDIGPGWRAAKRGETINRSWGVRR